MKVIVCVCILLGFCSTVAFAQKPRKMDRPKWQDSRIHGGNSKGEFTRRETSTVRRYEKHALREARRNEKSRAAENDRRRVDARRAEKSFAKKNS